MEDYTQEVLRKCIKAMKFDSTIAVSKEPMHLSFCIFFLSRPSLALISWSSTKVLVDHWGTFCALGVHAMGQVQAAILFIQTGILLIQNQFNAICLNSLCFPVSSERGICVPCRTSMPVQCFS